MLMSPRALIADVARGHRRVFRAIISNLVCVYAELKFELKLVFSSCFIPIIIPKEVQLVFSIK